MNEELLQQAASLFDSPEKWSAFVELMNKSEEIQNRWWEKLQQEVLHKEKKDLNSNWDIDVWDHWNIEWYIKGEADNTFIIHFWGDGLGVYNYSVLDNSKVKNLIQESRFDIIKDCFDGIDGRDKNSQTIAQENGNFTFGSIHDERFKDKRSLVWYAGNRTEEFANQLINKVRKLQTEEITNLFKEINEKCKKDN
jgi:hypothetical protein